MEAWLAIEKKLQTDPLHFGEVCYHLLNGELRCHIGAIKPVALEFGIHEAKRIVLVRKVILLGT